MARFVLEALLVAVSVQAVAVSGLRCPCLVQGFCRARPEGIYCVKTSPFGDRDAYYDGILPLLINQSAAEEGTDDIQERQDHWESLLAYEREMWYGWPACRSGYCDISHNNGVWELMEKFQFGVRSKAPPGHVEACVNVSLFAYPFYNQFLGCGIVPEDQSKWELNQDCKEAGAMLSFGRGRQYGFSLCIDGFTTTPASAATATVGLSVLASIASATASILSTMPLSRSINNAVPSLLIGGLLATIIHQASAIVCPCQVNVTVAYGYRNYIRVVSTALDGLDSLTKALRMRAAGLRVCDLMSQSARECSFERGKPEKLVIPFWPGCSGGRCEITRGAGELWQVMSDYQNITDGQPGCITAVIANDTANGRRIQDYIHDLIRFRGCGIIPKTVVAPGDETFCKLQMGVHGDEHLCIIEYETASKSAASGKFPWLVLLLGTLLILAAASGLVARRMIQKNHTSKLAGLSVFYWNQKNAPA